MYKLDLSQIILCLKKNILTISNNELQKLEESPKDTTLINKGDFTRLSET